MDCFVYDFSTHNVNMSQLMIAPSFPGAPLELAMSMILTTYNNRLFFGDVSYFKQAKKRSEYGSALQLSD